MSCVELNNWFYRILFWTFELDIWYLKLSILFSNELIFLVNLKKIKNMQRSVFSGLGILKSFEGTIIFSHYPIVSIIPRRIIFVGHFTKSNRHRQCKYFCSWNAHKISKPFPEAGSPVQSWAERPLPIRGFCTRLVWSAWTMAKGALMQSAL